MNIAERKQFLENQLKEINAREIARHKRDCWLLPVCVISICAGVYFGSWIAWIIAVVSLFWGTSDLEASLETEFHKEMEIRSRLDELQKLESSCLN
jgi:hypothetical protein